MRKYRASITVFMGMTIMMIMSIFFSLLEVVHYTQVKLNCVTISKMAQESMFADYCRPMWEEYGLLGIDSGYGGSSVDVAMSCDRMNEYLLENSSIPERAAGVNHLTCYPLETVMVEYGLMTDDDGGPFIKQCASSVMHSIPSGLLDSLSDQAQRTGEGQMDWEDYLTEGQQGYEDAISPDEDEDYDDEFQDLDSDDYRGDPDIENPMETVLEWKDNGVLGQVVDLNSISDRKLKSKEVISDRKLNKGNNKTRQKASLTDKYLFHYYLSDRFANYVDHKDRKGLNYELEYVLAGKKTDKENLAAAVERLLVYRGAMNLIAFPMDPSHDAKARALAVSMVGFTGNPAIIKVVKMGVIAAWVYAESVMDVRTLLAGGRISMIKDPSEWTSTLSSLPSCLSGGHRAKECQSGLNYSQYLGSMLLLMQSKVAAYRAMDVIEQEVAQHAQYDNFKMDCCVYQATTQFSFQAASVFASFITVTAAPDAYKFTTKESLSYL